MPDDPAKIKKARSAVLRAFLIAGETA